MRPSILHVGGTVFWVIRTYNPDTSVLKDADSTPTVAVRKNGSSVGDSVTVTKRTSTTGIYDCSYTPSGTAEGDEFTIEETAVVTGTTTAQATYSQSWVFTIAALERGTNLAALATGVNVTEWGGAAVASASVRANLISILGTTLTETVSGYLTAGFKKLFDVATPVLTAASVNQTGDSFARIGTNGAGLTTLATAAQINSLSVNTRANIQVPIEIEIPDSSTQVYKIRLHLYDEEGNMEAPDSTPTIALTNAAGTDRSSRLSAATTIGTGAYSWNYTATAGDAEEQLVWVFTVVEGSLTRTYPATSYVVEETAFRFSSSDRATLNAAATASGLTDAVNSIKGADGDTLKTLSDQIDSTATTTALAAVSTKLGTPAGASVSADIAAVKTDTGNLVTRITSTLFSGITYLSRWLGAMAGKTADSATLTEIQATTAGAGYNNTTDSPEALRDRGDAAWLTGSSSGGLTSDQAAALTRIDTKTALITGGRLQVAGAVTPGGDITLVIGDDHVAAAGSQLVRTISDTGGALHTRLTAAASITFGAGRAGTANQITGTVTSSYSANVTTLTITIDSDNIDSDAIPSEDYTYQVQRVTADGDHVVEVSGNLTLLTRYVARTA